MKTNRFIDACASFGAVIVIFASWSKLLHKEYADTFLTIGLLTECVIFGIYGFLAIFYKKEKPQSGNSYSVTQQLTDNSKLTDSVDNLTNTIKKVFNQ